MITNINLIITKATSVNIALYKLRMSSFSR